MKTVETKQGATYRVVESLPKRKFEYAGCIVRDGTEYTLYYSQKKLPGGRFTRDQAFAVATPCTCNENDFKTVHSCAVHGGAI